MCSFRGLWIPEASVRTSGVERVCRLHPFVREGRGWGLTTHLTVRGGGWEGTDMELVPAVTPGQSFLFKKILYDMQHCLNTEILLQHTCKHNNTPPSRIPC